MEGQPPERASGMIEIEWSPPAPQGVPSLAQRQLLRLVLGFNKAVDDFHRQHGHLPDKATVHWDGRRTVERVEAA